MTEPRRNRQRKPIEDSQKAAEGMRVSHMALASASRKDVRPQPNWWTIQDPPPGVVPRADKLAMDSAYGDIASYASGFYGANAGYGEGLRFLGYPFLAELLLRSEYRRMVSVLAQEMTRKWCKITSTGDEDKSDKIRALEAAMKKFRVRDVFREAAEHDSGFGIAHIYIDTDSSPDELRVPLFASKAKVRKGALKRLKVIEPLWCYPGSYNSTDPLSPSFYRPEFWYVMSKPVHYTRLLTLVSRDVPDILKPGFMFGGVALTQLAKPTVDNWLQTRQSVNDLLHSFTVWQLKTNMASTLMGGDGSDLDGRAMLFTRFRDNRGLMVTDKETEDLANISAPLGTLDHLQAQAQEHIAAVDGMPLIKLVGYTPSGLNTTGEGEMDAWRDRVRAQQEHLFNRPLKQVMDIIQLSEFGEVDEEIGFEWESIDEQNEAELASIRKTDADTGAVLIAAGVIAPEEERQRLASDEGSLYHGLDPADVPELPENEEDPLGEVSEPSVVGGEVAKAA
jgi:phage-related protein (TIGR01555 family)